MPRCRGVEVSMHMVKFIDFPKQHVAFICFDIFMRDCNEATRAGIRASASQTVHVHSKRKYLHCAQRQKTGLQVCPEARFSNDDRILTKAAIILCSLQKPALS